LKPKRKPTKLRDMRVAEVSLVNRGANQHAVVTLAKRHTDEAVTNALIDRDEYYEKHPWMAAEYIKTVNVDNVHVDGDSRGTVYNVHNSSATANERTTNMQTTVTKAEAGRQVMDLIHAKAAEYRKSHPDLTEAQCFARVYEAPENVDLRKAERWCHGFAEFADDKVEKAWSVAREEPLVEQGRALDGLKRLAAELRRNHPFLTEAQAFAKVYTTRRTCTYRKPSAKPAGGHWKTVSRE
jgi:hypothetical protein